ncbi:MAG: hypothetical protein C0501_10820, partial [Isosphaera sp.]|nr:hypothetical protein [Isosphaera sp.]
SPGGPVVNDRGELVGVLSEKESAQVVGYAVAADEVAAFLDAVRPDRPARTLAGLVARVEALPAAFAAAAAAGLGRRAEQLFRDGRGELAAADIRAALRLDPRCVPALRAGAMLHLAGGRLGAGRADLDAAAAAGPFDRLVLSVRADLAADAKDWRAARGDLERLLGVDPTNQHARRRLVPVLLELGEDAKAAAAVADVLRVDPKLLMAVAADLLAQAEVLAKKFPDAPSVPAGWLVRAMTAAKRDEFAAALKRAAAATDDAARLAALRDGLRKLR